MSGNSKRLQPWTILKARCPRCQEGKILAALLWVRPRCEKCDLNFYPESGFYLGAIMVGYLATAMLTIPPLIALKLMNVDLEVLMIFPFVEFLFLGTFLMVYSKVLWLHLEYLISDRLDSANPTSERKD